MSRESIAPLQRPDVIIPDTGPLIHLAQVDALHLLHGIGQRVIVPDMVVIEATADLDRPGAQAIRNWIRAGQAEGTNQPVILEQTDVGTAYTAAREARPDFRWRGAGELAIVEWLTTNADRTAETAIVLYENGRVPRMVSNAGLDADIDILTTRALLDLAQTRGLIDSAADYWERILTIAPTINPAIVVTSHRKPNL